MSVDKFGRHITFSILKKEVVKGEKGEGFHRTEDGHYDMKQKLLKNIANPLHVSDAATKEYVDSNLPKVEDGVWAFKSKRLSQAADPVEASDVATKHYVDQKVPEENVDFWKFKGKRLSNIGDPVYDGESVNVRYLKKCSIVLSDNEDSYDIGSRRLKRVGEPIDDNDAVTLKKMKYDFQLFGENIEQYMKSVRVMIKRLGIEIYRYMNKKEPKSTNEGPQNFINWDTVFNTT